MTPKPLHILHCIYSMDVGGAETMLVDIANGQVAAGHRVTVLVVNDIANESLLAQFVPAVEIIRMRRKQGDKPLLMMARLNLFILRLRPDVIHAHHHKFCRLVLARKNRLVLTVHCLDTEMIYASRSHMVAITDTVRDDVRNRVPRADITTIFNGLRTGDITRRPDRGLPATLRIVQVGNLLYDVKGQDLLIEALGVLGRRGIKSVEVTFIGRGDSAPLVNLAERLGVADRVHFAGPQDRAYIYAHLSDFDAMCHPSRSEGFGLTVAEGMAAGLPLILTEHDGPWEVADNGRLCLSGTNGNAESFADAIEKLMADYPEALRRADEAARYVERFDIAHTVAAYIDYYRRRLLR